MTSAYDNVIIPILLEKLKRLGLPSSWIYGINTFLAKRTIYVRHLHPFIGPLFLYRGLPQGAILSPLLHILYNRDLEEIIPPNVHILQYADDLCLYSSGTTEDSSVKKLIEGVKEVDVWLHTNGLEISSSKSTVVIFSRRVVQRKEIRVGSYSFEVKPSAKFLGMWFDSRMSWIPHINSIINNCLLYEHYSISN